MYTSASAPDRPPGSRTRRALTGEIVRFALVGGLGVAVNFAVFNLCRAATHLPVVRCSVIGTSVALLVNYLGFRYFAYRDRDKHRPARQFTLFFVFSVIGLVVENGVLYAATYWFGWDSALQSNLFKAVGLAAATGFRFGAYRTWVFRPRDPLDQPGPSPSRGDPARTRRH
ncbi:GtrA family protein [Streptomyces coacervatus]|uniref:GtrA family protein n=1 Tax=Streptomyces coacervatus TaxID=647381 RepID=A0ABP7JL20_9ACTN|nr:GtrA family protein [Streptomyces coacervatus]MDF2264511.1 GtrA family protein [Streptomyces coacervatus]